MAILTSDELAHIRQALAASGPPGYTKPQVNGALQAIEDAMTTTPLPAGSNGKTIPQVLSIAVDAGAGVFVFSAAQKKLLFALWSDLKFQRDK